MCGLRLNWTCNKCATEMHDEVSFVNLYTINGTHGFVKMQCDKCGHIHYVNSRTSEVIDNDNVNTISQSGVCAF